ncbi:hypothetical protein IMW75_12820 [Pseudomonas gregormendelii]|uniref:Uncharacterized protein n=2 Tax=Pseudomonas gregormendelii TaxID=1628277 RepID=A0ABS3AG66_9PSED|nr:hypothetical protein [Pseudomonas gregormendelii]
MICFVIPASAMQIDITAKFAPDPANPYMNKFKNTTPNSGWCAFRNQCLRLPIKFESNAEIVVRHSVRRGPMFKVPSDWQAVEIRHKITGESKFVKIRIAGIGSEYVADDVNGLVGGGDFRESHQKLWLQRGWQGAPRPCRDGGVGYSNEYMFGFFWQTPVAGVCAKTAAFAIPWMNYNYLDINYELDLPSPLDMSSGQYGGQLNLTIGPGGHFDMGDVMIPSDDTLTMNFTLDVRHVLHVEIPPGGNRVELLPEGGWQAWLQNPARLPGKLFRDQTFHIWTFSPFKMYLACESSADNPSLCSLKNERNDQVPLDVRVSLPSGFTDNQGLSISRRALYKNHSDNVFYPGFYVVRGAAKLYFEVRGAQVKNMLTNHPGTTYSGTVTVIWDSEV